MIGSAQERTTVIPAPSRRVVAKMWASIARKRSVGTAMSIVTQMAGSGCLCFGLRRRKKFENGKADSRAKAQMKRLVASS